MKPIRSSQDLKSLATFYCSKRETSEAKLKAYLKRKLLEQNLDEPLWVQEALQFCIEKKWVDNRRYSEMLTREYLRQGRGKYDIELKLKQKGLELPQDEEVLASLQPHEEVKRAYLLAQKILKRDSRLKTLPLFQQRQKLLQKVVSKGYSLSIAKKAIELLEGENNLES